MVKHMWPVPHSMRSTTCPACQTSGGDRYFCDRCETQYCGYCSHTKHHKCTRKNDQRPATTSKAPALVQGAQHFRGAGTATAPPMPPPQRKHSSKQQGLAASTALQRHSSSRSKKQGGRGKQSDLQNTKDTPKPQSPAPLKRGYPPASPRSPSRELSPYLQPRQKTHKAQDYAPQCSALQASEVTDRPKRAKHGERDLKRRRPTPDYHSPRHTKKEPRSPSQSSASSPREKTKERPSPASPGAPGQDLDKCQSWASTEEDGREVELTHTYRIKERVYDAVTQAIRAGYNLDRNRTTLGLSQLHPEAALRILSNLAHPMYTSPQQYIDHCIGDEWHKNSAQHLGHQQPHRHALAIAAKDTIGRHYKPKPKIW